jgi:hypothetical protein
MTGRENSGKGGAMKNFSALSLTALLLLAACGGPAKPGVSGKRGEMTFYCPNPAVLQEAQTATFFLPGQQGVAARVSTAQITGITGDCQYEKDKNAVLVIIKTQFLADNGPANNGAPLSLPWFVAINTADDTIIQKTNYIQVLKFDGNSSTVGATAKPVKVELPNSPDTQNIQILVGFQESPDQIAYEASHPEAAP